MTLSILLALLVTLPSDDFSERWHDGRAEMDGYRLSVQRYGVERAGEGVMIYVTEPFSVRERVKADDPARNPSDVTGVLKLNFVRDFQTGLYDYNTMTSLFVRENDFRPLKVSFSSAEWCGHVYEELTGFNKTLDQDVRSYFQGESGTRRLTSPEGGMVESNLFVLLRGLRGPYLPAGEKRAVPFLPGTFHRRLTHAPTAWKTAVIERDEGERAVDVAAGRFEVIQYTVRVGDERVGRFLVEAGAPHRIVRWAWTKPDGLAYEGAHAGELTGSERMRYWELHAEGDQAARRRLGL